MKLEKLYNLAEETCLILNLKKSLKKRKQRRLTEGDAVGPGEGMEGVTGWLPRVPEAAPYLVPSGSGGMLQFSFIPALPVGTILSLFGTPGRADFSC